VERAKKHVKNQEGNGGFLGFRIPNNLVEILEIAFKFLMLIENKRRQIRITKSKTDNDRTPSFLEWKKDNTLVCCSFNIYELDGKQEGVYFTVTSQNISKLIVY